MTTTPPLPRASDQAAERTLEQRLESIREFGDSQLFNDVRTGQIPIHTALERIESERAAIAHSAAQAPEGAGIYVASRASVPARPQMWRSLRAQGWPIVSTWIDEAGEGETGDFRELWQRIHDEIAGSCGVILYAEESDFPLKGAFIECGMALGMGKPVAVVLKFPLMDRSMKPLGSWANHPLVKLCQSLDQAKRYVLSAATPAAPTCTPADERAQFIAHQRKVGSIPDHIDDETIMKGEIVGHEWKSWQARAAQGAGTAPVEATERAPIGYITIGDVEHTCEGAEIGGWDIDWDHKVIDAMEEFSVPEATYAVYLEPVSAPVSTAAAPTCKPAQAGQQLMPTEATPEIAHAIRTAFQDASATPATIYAAVLGAVPAPVAAPEAPIPMILHCPKCGLQHVDEPDERTPDWQNPPHRSHLCHGCGNIWRPADVTTIGVKSITTRGKNDSAAPEAPATEQQATTASASRDMTECAACDGRGCTHYPDGEWQGKCGACKGTGIDSRTADGQQGELPRQIDAALFNWANAVKCGNSDDRARTRAVMIAVINAAIAADGQQGAAAATTRTVVGLGATVYVCPERDIECGSRAANWCATCPKRRTLVDGQQGASRAALDLGSIDANKLEAMAKEMPDECFLKGSGVLKLIGAIRQLEQAAIARAPLPVQGKDVVATCKAAAKGADGQGGAA